MHKFCRPACALLMAVLAGFCFSACRPQAEEPPAAPPAHSRALVAYFSLWDNAGQPDYVDAQTSASVVVHNGQSVGATGYVVRQLEALTGGSLYPIRTEQTYPSDRQSVEAYNRQSSARPALAGAPPDVQAYDVIYLGYPIWNDQIPGAVYSFLARCDWSGKTIVPFCTCEEGTAEGTYAAIAAAVPEAEVVQTGFAILPEEMSEARTYLSVWLEGLYTLKEQPQDVGAPGGGENRQGGSDR